MVSGFQRGIIPFEFDDWKVENDQCLFGEIKTIFQHGYCLRMCGIIPVSFARSAIGSDSDLYCQAKIRQKIDLQTHS